ncbi:MAG: hypothetical protein WCM76_14275 [Bacteroidota bacterium]
MEKELIEQAKAMFDTPEKWNAFLELFWQRDEIRNQWYSKLKEEANKRFKRVDSENGWSFNSWGFWDMHWYLTADGDKSISLLLGWWGELTLFCDENYFDTVKITELLKTEKFAPLLSGFNRIDRFFERGRIAIEIRNFSFASVYDSHFDLERLAWFAGNKTEDFLNQIVNKVNIYREDEKMTSLISELNQLTKKNIE